MAAVIFQAVLTEWLASTSNAEESAVVLLRMFMLLAWMKEILTDQLKKPPKVGKRERERERERKSH